MIISDLYKTVISCVSEVPMDTERVEVTVSLKDFNNEPVIGKKVNLTVDKGRFNTVINGMNPTVSSTGKKASADTNSKGEIIVTYTANEVGLVTFTANEDSKNQLLVNGWKKITTSYGDLYVNEAIRCAEFKLSYSNSINISSTSSTNLVVINEIKNYPPLHELISIGNRADVRVALSSTGQINYRGENTTTLTGLTATFFWHY